MKLHLLQYDIVWENPQANWLKVEQLLAESQPGLASVVILPEMFSTGFSMNTKLLAEPTDGPTVHWMKNIARNNNILLAGSLIIEENGHYFNRFLWVSPNGSVQHYDKRHLFRMNGENEFFTAGKQRLIIEYCGVRILPLVCYDLRFPVWSRNSGDYDLIVYAANWPAARSGVWNTLLKARAIENQCYVAGVNRYGTDGNATQYAGQSQVIDFKGDVVKIAGEDEFVVSAVIDIPSQIDFKERFPAWKDADCFQLSV